MKQLIKDFKEMTDLLKQDASRYWKEDILRRYPECKILLQYIYNPIINFNITGDGILKFSLKQFMPTEWITDYVNSYKYNIYRLFQDLDSRTVSGDKAYGMGLLFLTDHQEHSPLIIEIFNRDLTAGISIKTINKVWKNLIPEFKTKVPLAKEYKGQEIDFENERWFLSRKLDGIRCLVFVKSQTNVELYSRNGIRFETLDKVKETLINRFDHYPFKEGIVLDGEICLFDPDTDLESFNGIMQQIRRKNYTIENPRFYIFDWYPIDKFQFDNKYDYGVGGYELKMSLLNKYLIPNSTIKILDQIPITHENDFQNIPTGWEGYILRKDGPTLFKRSNHLLKVKNFKEAEYIVLGVVPSKKLIDGEIQNCVGSLIIKHKGHGVEVGSGLTDIQRLQWYYNSSKIVGKPITVKYFSESKDKNGIPSLRFPILKVVWEKEKE